MIYRGYHVVNVCMYLLTLVVVVLLYQDLLIVTAACIQCICCAVCIQCSCLYCMLSFFVDVVLCRCLHCSVHVCVLHVDVEVSALMLSAFSDVLQLIPSTIVI